MFEVIVVEDGSQITCKEVCERFSEQLNLHYYYKENSGPGQSRNYGADKSCGEYYIVLDSDVVLPETYMQHIIDEIKREPCDAFGGPDRGTSRLFAHTKSHFLLYDLVFYHWRNKRWQEKTRQVLSPFIQHGHQKRCL